MEFPFPLEWLNRASSYPQATGPVTVKQTHISVVAILAELVYKLRKPVRTPFLDFSTLELRRDDCQREIALNRRLAPDVYLSVVPIARHGAGIAVDPPVVTDEVVEWAVKMRRLPAESTLLQRLRTGQLSSDVIERLAQRIADFHQHAEATPEMAAFGRSERVLENALDNLTEAIAHPIGPLHPGVLTRIRERTRVLGRSLAPLMDRRALGGWIRDTHGDLHLDHIYWFPEHSRHDEFVIIDCVEFNERFRYADPIADMAFTCMDLGFRGRRDLAQDFARSYFEATRDEEGRQLLPFYSAYRAAVRAKVESIQARESEVPVEEREAARQRATAHWLYALGELSEPHKRPALILFCGLPGSGKSTLARTLLDSGPTHIRLIRSDIVRRELHRMTPDIERYGPAMNDQTYTACIDQAREALLLGQRVLVDANFPLESRREPFVDLADALAIPCVFVQCVVREEVALSRLAEREGDASEADGRVYEIVSSRWESPGPRICERTITIDTDRPLETLRTELLARLAEHRLA